jgi:hypothetical protein
LHADAPTPHSSSRTTSPVKQRDGGSEIAVRERYCHRLAMADDRIADVALVARKRRQGE